MDQLTWTKKEKQIARRAFNKSYERECDSIAKKAHDMSSNIESPGDIWRLHGFLTQERRQIDDKYDYRYSRLILVFARLMSEGWIKKEDLEGLKEDKISKIVNAANFLKF